MFSSLVNDLYNQTLAGHGFQSLNIVAFDFSSHPEHWVS